MKLCYAIRNKHEKLLWVELCSPKIDRFPQRLRRWRICLQCRRSRRCRFDPWVGKILWRGKWQSTLVFLSAKFHGQRSLAAAAWGRQESDLTGRLKSTRSPTTMKITELNPAISKVSFHAPSAGNFYLIQTPREEKWTVLPRLRRGYTPAPDLPTVCTRRGERGPDVHTDIKPNEELASAVQQIILKTHY